MPSNIIKDGAIIEDKWQLLGEDATAKQLTNDFIIVTLALWQEQGDLLKAHDSLGLLLDSDQSPQQVADDLGHFKLVAINFPGFVDGRGFSYARELRETHKFRGEVRAVGNFIRDQLFFLQRCGFNAFALTDNGDLNNALASLQDFSDSYQAATDQALPLFKRR